MKELLNKLAQQERTIAEEKGPFYLFALFLRDEAPGVWELVFAAPWVDDDKYAALTFMAERMQEVLQPAEIVKLSAVVPVESLAPGLQELLEEVQVEHGLVKLPATEYFGMEIQADYVFTAQRLGNVPEACPPALHA